MAAEDVHEFTLMKSGISNSTQTLEMRLSAENFDQLMTIINHMDKLRGVFRLIRGWTSCAGSPVKNCRESNFISMNCWSPQQVRRSSSVGSMIVVMR